MTKVKKLVLGVSVALSMLVALVVGFVCNFGSPTSKNVASNTTISGDTEVSQEVVKPTTYTYLPGEVLFKRGGSTLNYNYTPSTDMKDDAKTVAYEYCFGNTMQEATAVNLKEIDTTDVTVSYAWSLNTKLDTTQSITTYTNYELQRLNNYGDKVYIYVFVTPTNETVPTTFTSSIVWYYGMPYEMPIFNNVTNTVEYQTIVDGQKIDKNTLNQPTAPTGYYFDAWFLDEDFTQLVEEDDVKTGRTMYARYANLPDKWLSLNGNEYMVVNGGEQLSGAVVIPTMYNGLPVTSMSATTMEEQDISKVVFIQQTNITSIDIPNTITNIPFMTFLGCSNLSKVILPQTLTTIGLGAFTQTGLTNITIPDSVTSIGESAFAQTGLTNITIPDSVTSIGSGVFRLCTSLISVTLPSSLTTIGTYAFSGCGSLTSIDLSRCTSLTSIGQDAFSECEGLTSIDLSKCTNLTTIGNDAFQKCTSLTSITLPSSLTTIGNQAFDSCSSLTSIDLSKCTNLTTIGSAFYFCSSLTSVDLSKCTSLTSIGASAFRSSGLTSITLPSSLTTIGNNAFYQCSSLTSITLPSSVTKIGLTAFPVTGLTNLTIQGWDSGTWYYTSYADYTGGEEFTGSFADASQNATWFKSSSYYNYYWYKVS